MSKLESVTKTVVSELGSEDYGDPSDNAGRKITHSGYHGLEVAVTESPSNDGDNMDFYDVEFFHEGSDQPFGLKVIETTDPWGRKNFRVRMRIYGGWEQDDLIAGMEWAADQMRIKPRRLRK